MEICEIKLLRVYDVDLLGLFLRFFTTSFELRAVDRRVFCHLSPRPAPPAPQSLSHNLRRHRSPSRRPARGCVSSFFVSCVMSIYLSIDLCVHFSPGLLAAAAAPGFVCYIAAAVLLAATSQPNVYWLEEGCGPGGQRFGEWASASRTFSAITDLIAVVQREVDRLCSFFRPCMHAPPPPACLLRLLLTAATFSPSRHRHQTWRWRALSAYATAASPESFPGCLFNGTGTLYRPFSVTRPKPRSNVHTQGKTLFAEGIPWA